MNVSYQSPPTWPDPGTYRAAASTPLAAGSAEGTRLRCRAIAAAWSSRDCSDCTAVAARSAASSSSAASSGVKTRLCTVPTCSTPSTVPWTSSGTPASDWMPFSYRIGLSTLP